MSLEQWHQAINSVIGIVALCTSVYKAYGHGRWLRGLDKKTDATDQKVTALISNGQSKTNQLGN